MSDELKPCRYCNHDMLSEYDHYSLAGNNVRMVLCGACGCSTPKSVWNTRAYTGLVEALRGVIVVGESHSDDVDGKLNMILIKAQAALTAHEEANKCE